MKQSFLYLALLTLLLFSCKKEDDQPTNTVGSTPPNILLIIADDMGKDATAGFSEGSVKPNTPHLNFIRDNGLVFQNFWVNPTCSPTRASIITGKYGYRTGVKWANDILDESELCLQRYINEQTNDAYATAIIGKWHLSGENTGVNPESFGIDHYAGLIRGAAQSYDQWQITEDGIGSLQTEYITEVFTDLSIEWVNQQSKPWFLWLAYTAPHTPFHAPPSEMHSQGDLPDFVEGMDATPYYMAAIEAMDYQIGRLLENIPEDEIENTLIFFLGDNGSPVQVAQAPYSPEKSKGSLYQGGVNVPLFVSGAGVNRMGEETELANSTDLFATIASACGVNVSEYEDSKSFLPLLSTAGEHRVFQYAEMDNGTDNLWTISNGSYKLIQFESGEEELYHLIDDPYESNDLLLGQPDDEALDNKAVLEAELENIRD